MHTAPSPSDGVLPVPTRLQQFSWPFDCRLNSTDTFDVRCVCLSDGCNPRILRCFSYKRFHMAQPAHPAGQLFYDMLLVALCRIRLLVTNICKKKKKKKKKI
jgi:hypothetical protein